HVPGVRRTGWLRDAHHAVGHHVVDAAREAPASLETWTGDRWLREQLGLRVSERDVVEAERQVALLAAQLEAERTRRGVPELGAGAFVAARVERQGVLEGLHPRAERHAGAPRVRPAPDLHGNRGRDRRARVERQDVV